MCSLFSSVSSTKELFITPPHVKVKIASSLGKLLSVINIINELNEDSSELIPLAKFLFMNIIDDFKGFSYSKGIIEELNEGISKKLWELSVDDVEVTYHILNLVDIIEISNKCIVNRETLGLVKDTVNEILKFLNVDLNKAPRIKSILKSKSLTCYSLRKITTIALLAMLLAMEGFSVTKYYYCNNY